jgi:hypothetical protein
MEEYGKKNQTYKVINIYNIIPTFIFFHETFLLCQWRKSFGWKKLLNKATKQKNCVTTITTIF